MAEGAAPPPPTKMPEKSTIKQWRLRNYFGFETYFANGTFGAWAQNMSQIKVFCAILTKGAVLSHARVVVEGLRALGHER